ncbi:4-hydroxythreonine-4-phosphate dehydrogenase [Mesorhizobium silamurunense]|uniref:4-hydroxythreonine-4-phosphate dehydrogenase n=1 Tax=Mesorhizobium silamurunense TaxID=499528 RepID=UPI001783CAAA|nr:4-hydroxythreonine-4-phosphate dehydrogenase [Mesorhizobium silamurunense]
MSRFIFMLTQNDVTVPDARAVFEEISDLPIPFVGFKDIGLPVHELKALADSIRANGQEVMLEVVSQTKDDELRSIRAGLEIGVDYILGGTHTEEAVEILAGSGLKYMPFPGTIVGHPSRLTGAPEEIVASARALCTRQGVAGLDLLAYRFDGNVEALIANVIASIDLPLIVAGSIASVERIKTVSGLGAWGFTIGGAVFDRAFLGERTLRGQLQTILDAAGKAVAGESHQSGSPSRAHGDAGFR